MRTLIIAEHNHQKLQSATLNLIQAALQLKAPIVILIAGHECDRIAAQAAQIAGVSEVWLADNACYARPLAENLSQLVQVVASPFSYIIMSASTFGKNILPRVAALLDVTQVSDVTKIISDDTFEHPIYAGNAIETVRVLDEKKLLTIRTTAFDAMRDTQPPCKIVELQHHFASLTQWIEHQSRASARPELRSANIVVAGGRGLQSAEQFKLIEALADELGAAVGASRAAVDAGFVPNEVQVGQTGKIVAPSLYFAIGISGAVQHIAGMKDSKVIVAINKDPDAPIFQMANYGLVGDLFEIVPQLITALKKHNACHPE